MIAPLAGKTIVVTRPRGQAASLAQAIAAAGGAPLLFPLLEISPARDLRDLQAAARQLADYAWAVFISPNAVEYSLPALLRAAPWPGGVRAAAVGLGTANALAAHGVAPCLTPARRFDSEALLALPELAGPQVAGRRMVIFRGDGGRELLVDSLRDRGAQVDSVTCYRRSPPDGGPQPLLDAWRAKRLDAIAISSSEGLRHLAAMLDEAGHGFLAATPLFVPHPRIAESAAALGLHNIVQTGPADAGILAGLCAYNWPS